MAATPLLEQRSERTLSLLASAVCGAPVVVVTSTRLVAAGAASLARRTIWLDPHRTGPYDLVLLAGLLRRRRTLLARGFPRGAAARRRFVERTRTALEREFEALPTLDGRWRGGVAAGDLPELAVDGPTMAGLSFDGAGAVGASLVPGERLEGAEADLDRLAEAIADGRVATRTHPGMPGLPYVEMPLTLRMHDVAREVTEEEREIRREVDEGARGIVSCYENKTQGTVPVRVRPPRTSGVRLDPRRLHEVAVALAAGRPARPFARPPREVSATFRPEQHYGILGFDAPSLHRMVARRGRLRVNLLRLFARCFELMEIDAVIVGFRDRVLTLPDGRDVYVHVPCVAKAATEPFSDAVWQRLQALWAPPSGAGVPACAVSLQLETLARHAREAVAEHERRFLTLQYMSVAELPAPHASYGARAAAAATADDVLRRLQAEVDGEWGLSLFVPTALLGAAPPGGAMADASDLAL